MYSAYPAGYAPPLSVASATLAYWFHKPISKKQGYKEAMPKASIVPSEKLAFKNYGGLAKVFFPKLSGR